MLDNTVTNRQMFFIIFLIVSSVSVIALPKKMADTAGTGAWIPILAMTFFYMIVIAIFSKLNNTFPGMTFFEYAPLLIGKVATYCITVLYIAYFASVAALMVRYIGNVIEVTFLPNTPVWATMFILLAISGYAASKGLPNVARLFEFLCLIVIIIYVFIFFTMFTRGDFINLKPFFDPHMIKDYARALPLLIFSFQGIEVLSIIPFNQNNKKATRYLCLSIFSVGIVYIVIVSTTYMMLSMDDTRNYLEPFIRSVRMLEVPALQVLQRFDIFFIIAWVFGMFCSLSMLTYTVSEYTSKIIPKINKNWLVFCAIAVIYILALIPKKMVTVLNLFNYLTLSFGLFPVFIIPTTLLIIAKVKKSAGKLH